MYVCVSACRSEREGQGIGFAFPNSTGMAVVQKYLTLLRKAPPKKLAHVKKLMLKTSKR